MKFIRVNIAFENLLGYSKAELIGREVWGIIHPEDQANSESKTIIGVENRVRARNGSYRWLRWTGVAGEECNYAAAFDVTDQKEFEKALRESEERLRLSQQVARIGTFEWNIKDNEARWTAELESLYGLAKGSSSGSLEEWLSLIHPDDRKQALIKRECALETGLFEAEWRTILPDGQIRWIQGRGWVEKNDAGEPIRMIGVNIDISERKRAESALAESEAKFRQFAEAIPQLGWVAKPDGSTTWYNKNWYRYTGTTPEEMTGWQWQSVHHPEMLPEVISKWKESIETGKMFEMEFPLRGANGEYRWFLTRTVPFTDDRGNILAWFGTNTDIHEQRKAHEELKEALKTRDDFLSIASHELKTPISSLKLQAQLLKRRRNRGQNVFDKLDHFFDQIDQQVDRLNRLVDDMLDISRIRAGTLTINRDRVDLNQLISEVLDRLEPNLSDAETPVTLSCPPEIVGNWDRIRLEQVITNLITNAMKYGNHQSISVIVEATETSAIVSVKDQGIGIDDRFLNRIFDRFERGVSADEASGLGLGLFISRQIVEAHGGRIWVESQGPNQGSTFIIDLPFA